MSDPTPSPVERPVQGPLPPEDANEILGAGERISYAAGTAIFDAGDAGDAMFVISSGQARVDVGGSVPRPQAGRFLRRDGPARPRSPDGDRQGRVRRRGGHDPRRRLPVVPLRAPGGGGLDDEAARDPAAGGRTAHRRLDGVTTRSAIRPTATGATTRSPSAYRKRAASSCHTPAKRSSSRGVRGDDPFSQRVGVGSPRRLVAFGLVSTPAVARISPTRAALEGAGASARHARRHQRQPHRRRARPSARAREGSIAARRRRHLRRPRRDGKRARLGRLGHVSTTFSLIDGFVAHLTDGQINAMAHRPGVIRVEPNFEVHALDDAANDDFGVTSARSTFGVTGAGTQVCIPDSGVDLGHEQLDSKAPIGWLDLIEQQAEPLRRHGPRHVRRIDRGRRRRRPGPDRRHDEGRRARRRALGGEGYRQHGERRRLRSRSRAIQWCAARPAVDVISLSLGSDLPSDGLDAISQAVDAAVAGGKIVVAAAGNSGDVPGSITVPRFGEEGDHRRRGGRVVRAEQLPVRVGRPLPRPLLEPRPDGRRPDQARHRRARRHDRRGAVRQRVDLRRRERHVDGDALRRRRRRADPPAPAELDTDRRARRDRRHGAGRRPVPARTTTGAPACSTPTARSPRPTDPPGRRRSPRTSTSPGRSRTTAAGRRRSPLVPTTSARRSRRRSRPAARCSA